MNKYIFFDLDGTIADSTNVFVDSFNDFIKWLPIKKLSRDEFVKITIEDLIKKYHVPLFTVPFLISIMRWLFWKKAKDIKLFPNMEKLLIELSAKYKLGIATTSSKKYTDYVLKNNHISQYFTYSLSDCSLLNKTKQLKKFLKIYNINPEHLIFITDEARDLKSFHKNKIATIAVTWGYDCENILKKYPAEALVKTDKELLTAINSLIKKI